MQPVQWIHEIAKANLMNTNEVQNPQHKLDDKCLCLP